MIIFSDSVTVCKMSCQLSEGNIETEGAPNSQKNSETNHSEALTISRVYGFNGDISHCRKFTKFSANLILRVINLGRLVGPKDANFNNLIGLILKNAKFHQNQSLDTLIFFSLMMNFESF